MPFSKFVEIGRVAFIAFGHDQGKICAIVDVIDQNRALVDGPSSKVARQAVSFKQLHLTKFRIKFPHGASTGVVRKAWEKAKVNETWAETSWCRKLADKKKKARITDFDRFKLMKAKQTRNRIIHREVIKLKAQKKKKMQKVLKEARELRDKKKAERKLKTPKPKKMVKKEAPTKAKDAATKKKAAAPKKAPAAQKAAAKPAKK